MLNDQRVYSWRSAAPSLSGPNGPLNGLRLGVKDLFDVTGIATGAGNPDWLRTHPVPQHTASAVQKLLDAGASLLAKTQTDELAYSLNGLNKHYGAPVNPRAPDRLPGGSSSGSAVAVAAGDIDIGLGTDTGGSIRVPASYNGLFGLRPTHGVIALDHTVPLAPCFDTAGWLTRDAATLQKAGEVLLPAQDVMAADKVRVNVLIPTFAGEPLWQSDHNRWLLQQHDLLKPMRRILLTDAWCATASNCFRVLQGREIWRTHGDWITQTSPDFADDIRARFAWCATLTATDEALALQTQQQLVADISRWFDDADLVVMPTTPGAAPLLTADVGWMAQYRNHLMGLTAPAGLAGLPQLHLPALSDSGAPWGISLLGKAHHDRNLLQLAVRLESANG